jgi:hypothetical protein
LFVTLAAAACSSSGAGDGTEAGNGALSAPSAAGAKPSPPKADAGATASASSAPVSLANWTTQPQIVAIDKIRTDIDGQKDSLTDTHREGNICPNLGPKVRDMYSDAKENTLLFAEEDEENDGSATTSYYYDAAGVLRLVLRLGHSREEEEQRAYFDAQGKHLWEVNRSLQVDPSADDVDLSKVPWAVTGGATQLEVVDPLKKAISVVGWFDNMPECFGP